MNHYSNQVDDASRVQSEAFDDSHLYENGKLSLKSRLKIGIFSSLALMWELVLELVRHLVEFAWVLSDGGDVSWRWRAPAVAPSS